MLLVDGHHMVEQVAPAALDPALRNTVLPRTCQRSSQWTYPQASNGCGDIDPILRVPIKHQKPRSGVERESLSQLLHDPLARRMLGDVEVQNTAALMADHEKTVQHTHEANKRCVKHLGAAFGATRLVDVTADSIDLYLRERLRERIRVKAKLGYKQLGTVKSTTIHQEFRVLRRMLNVAVRKKLLAANPCSGVEFPVAVKGLFRPHYVSWSEQQQIEAHAPQYLRNVVRIITETGLRIYKELIPMRKDQVDLQNAVVWIPDSKTPNGTAEVPLTSLAIEAFKNQMAISGEGPYLFPSDLNPTGHLKKVKTVWTKTLRRAKIPYFRIYDLRSAYATRLSAGGVADEWVTQLLRQSDAQVFKKYSQMKLRMKREALEKLNRRANEMVLIETDALTTPPLCTEAIQ